MRHAPVIVVGAGPAGASCAARLTAAGIEPILLDRASFPRPKVCAGWITPRVFDLLQCTPDDYPGLLTTFTRLHVRLRGVPVPVRGTQYAIRRVEFDAWLVSRTGVTPEVHQVHRIEFESGRFVVDGQFSADTIVGAGGSQCPVARTFFNGAGRRPAGSAIVAMEEEFQAEPIDHRCRLWFFRNGLPGYAWYVPKGGAFVNVGIGGVRNSLRRRRENLRDHWDSFIRDIERRGLVSRRTWRPAGAQYFVQNGAPDGSKRVGDIVADRTGAETTPNVFLAGDSLGLATVDMGEGIGAAIESGQRAADAIISGGPNALDAIPRYSLLPAPFRRRFLTTNWSTSLPSRLGIRP